MRYNNEPLGCFQQVSYGLAGAGLYLACSLTTCGVLTFFTISPIQNGLSFPSLREMLGLAGTLAFSFFVAGPLMLGAYVLYLRDMHIIEVKDRPSSAAPAQTKSKRKNEGFTG